MKKDGARPYIFVGNESEIADPRRYDRALRAWTGYSFQHLPRERESRPGPRPSHKR